MRKLLNKTASSETKESYSWREKPWIYAITVVAGVVVGAVVGAMVFNEILTDIFF